ncbi:MAG: AAA family ATPase [Patescibacteria group bacterium]
MNYFIIIRGPLGCGKTTVAETLAKELNAKCFQVDNVLEAHNLTYDHEDGYISQKSFLKVNEIIAPQAKQALDDSMPVIFDGNFYWKSQIEDLIKRLVFPHYVFTLKAPVEICIARDAKRNPPHGEDAVRAVYNQTAKFDHGTVIDATRPLEKCIDEILTKISVAK